MRRELPSKRTAIAPTPPTHGTFRSGACRLGRRAPRSTGPDRPRTTHVSPRVDACRHAVRAGSLVIPITTRPVLFALARALGEAWPGDVSRDSLVACAFRAKHADESHRARLRVEIGRLRTMLRPLANVGATKQGFVLAPHHAPEVVVLARPVEEEHAAVLAFLADGESWSSSALALALGAMAGFTTNLLLTALLPV